MSNLEDNHRVALARELTAAAGVPLRDRYGFASSNEDVLHIVTVVATYPDDDAAVAAIGAANWTGVIEIAEGSDTPTSEEYEHRIVTALRPLIEQRRTAAEKALS